MDSWSSFPASYREYVYSICSLFGGPFRLLDNRHAAKRVDLAERGCSPWALPFSAHQCHCPGRHPVKEGRAPFRPVSWSPFAPLNCVNPCGRIVDMVRSCYLSAMRFGPKDVSPVAWFFVPITNPVMPFPHSFGSINYSQFKAQDGPLGELSKVKRPWLPGIRPPFFDDPRCPGSPTGFIGTYTQWRYGCGDAVAPWMSYGGLGFSGRTTVMMHGPRISTGGLSFNGFAKVQSPVQSTGGVEFEGSATVA